MTQQQVKVPDGTAKKKIIDYYASKGYNAVYSGKDKCFYLHKANPRIPQQNDEN